jgi:hypothetical protein
LSGGPGCPKLQWQIRFWNSRRFAPNHVLAELKQDNHGFRLVASRFSRCVFHILK